MQYVIFDALTNSDSPVSFECMLNALKGTCTYERMNDYECAINYGLQDVGIYFVRLCVGRRGEREIPGFLAQT